MCAPVTLPHHSNEHISDAQVVTHKTYRSPTTQKLKPVPDRARSKMVEPLDLTSAKRPRHECSDAAKCASIAEAETPSPLTVCRPRVMPQLQKVARLMQILPGNSHHTNHSPIHICHLLSPRHRLPRRKIWPRRPLHSRPPRL
jgi:hypothetical protein